MWRRSQHFRVDWNELEGAAGADARTELTYAPMLAACTGGRHRGDGGPLQLPLLHPKSTVAWAGNADSGQMVGGAKKYLNLTMSPMPSARGC
ncbi:hypothetical protein [Streptomyces montanus]|uniref:hypothetical protein n=1 Tax=Streptomyces montanus TaxID=2580423 RepID=UPI001486E244|nr:hypothetical protein [Streptomyces montanus]